MKKIKYFFQILLIFLIGIVAYNIFAECPPNWDSRGIFVNINGCLYFVVYCYKCGVTGPDGSNVKITHYSRLPREQQPNPDNCDDSEIPFDIISERVAQDFYQACTFPDCTTHTTNKFILEYPLCERYHNVAWWDAKEQKFKHFLWGESCNSNLYYCQIIRWCCKLGPNEYQCIRTDIVPQGNPQGCLEPSSPILPPEGDSRWNESWDTECYRLRECVDIK